MKKLLLGTVLLCLTACSATYPVKGMVDKTHERFVGTASASMLEKNASIHIVTDSGAQCSGSYPRPDASSGGVSASGNFTCTDGRTGHFAFSGTTQGGQGIGRFNNGQKFTFVYGGSGSSGDDAATAAALQSLGQGMQQISNEPRVHCTSSNSWGNSIETRCY